MWSLEVLEFLFKQLESMVVKCLDFDAEKDIKLVKQAAMEILAEKEVILNQTKPIRGDSFHLMEEARKQIQEVSRAIKEGEREVSSNLFKSSTIDRPRGVY